MGTVTQREYTLAQLSNSAYHDEAEIRRSGGLPEGWAIFKSQDTNSSTGFVAHAYFNESTKEIVIAYRGSEIDRSMIDWKKADFALAKDGDVDKLLRGTSLERQIPNAKTMIANAPNWDQQFNQGLEFADEIIKQYGGKYAISVTGHSLGGSIAQVASKMHNLPGVTFDPGGAKNLVDSAEFKSWAREHGKPEQGLGSNNAPTNYIVNKSIVSNYSGGHIGINYPISGIAHGGWKTTLSANGSLVDTWSRHSMPRILSEFKEAFEQKRPLNIIGNVNPERFSPLEPNASQLAQNHTTEKPTPSLSPVAQTIKQQCHSHVHGFCERNNQPWTEGMDNTYMALTVVAREAKMSGVDALGVSQGTIYIAQTDRKGIYREAEINSREAANIPLAQSEQRLAIVDQQMLMQEQQQAINNLAQTQHKVHSGPRMG